MAGSEAYFSKFPIISYNGTAVRDISRRVKLSSDLRAIPTAFHPWQISHDTRADVLAYQYYDDPTLHWLINLTNGIVDPYYGWLLTDDEFTAHVIDKYGSIADAQRRVHHWGTNWADDDINVSVTYYTNLPEQIKKYYVPNFGQGTKILSYGRRQEDWTMITNRIVSVPVTSTEGFAIGDLLDTYDTPTDVGNVVGFGEIIDVAPDGAPTLLIKNAIDDFTQVGNAIGKRDLTVSTSITSAPTIVTQPLSDLEGSFWEPVFCYDMELDANLKNGVILLLERNFANDAGETLAAELQSDQVF